MKNFSMAHRKEKAMKRFNSGGYKRGGHVTEIEIVMGAPKGMKKSGMGCKPPVRKAYGGDLTNPLGNNSNIFNNLFLPFSKCFLPLSQSH